MKLKEIVKKMDMSIVSGKDNLELDITHGYASDLLSDVIAHGEEGDVWVTLQIHQNIVAVAVMKSLGCIMMVNGRQPESRTIEKADAEDLPILVSEMPAFELVGRLHDLGITGGKL
jgi:hypothetical protein